MTTTTRTTAGAQGAQSVSWIPCSSLRACTHHASSLFWGSERGKRKLRLTATCSDGPAQATSRRRKRRARTRPRTHVGPLLRAGRVLLLDSQEMQHGKKAGTSLSMGVSTSATKVVRGTGALREERHGGRKGKAGGNRQAGRKGRRESALHREGGEGATSGSEDASSHAAKGQ